MSHADADDAGGDGAEVEEVRPGHEEDADRDDDVHAGRAEVRLGGDEEEAGRDEHGERHEPVPEGACVGTAPVEPVGQVEDHGQLRELGGLKRPDAGDDDPAPRAVDLGADARHSTATSSASVMT